MSRNGEKTARYLPPGLPIGAFTPTYFITGQPDLCLPHCANYVTYCHGIILSCATYCWLTMRSKNPQRPPGVCLIITTKTSSRPLSIKLLIRYIAGILSKYLLGIIGFIYSQSKLVEKLPTVLFVIGLVVSNYYTRPSTLPL